MQFSEDGTDLRLDGEASDKSPPGVVVDLLEIEPVACPCGDSRRAFGDHALSPGTLHLTDISENSRTHYHLQITETYVILECEDGAAMELDGELIPVEPLMAILIPPRVRHRAVGEMRALIYCTPKFDSDDEHFD